MRGNLGRERGYPITSRELVYGVGQKVLALIPKFSVIAAGCALIVAVGLVVTEVVARGVFRYSVPFAIEYSEYMLPVIVMWGTAYTLRRGSHISADILVSHLSARARLWLGLIGYIVGLAFLIIFAIQTFALVSISLKLHCTSLYPLRTPLGYVQLVMPIGLSLFALQLVVEIVRKARLAFLKSPIVNQQTEG